MGPTFLARHPILSGLIWAAIFIPVVALVCLLLGRTGDLQAMAILAIPGGIAWSYGMRWWYRAENEGTG